ncbi:glucokinase [Bartonella tamiae]|uniref:Glucokinase n=1 Tax=Bartonella tamiae Th239 TaxID=1094558 RepID=J1JZ28_9HYPH|nr:glucokinase [Bartonella tamiae]EJF90372.1 glucokinase [Bartonella tamiae Th239]EJF93684.1 glucokinase [Bartonella tamiae Th307]
MPDNVLEFPVLIGDIGGTNARFALIQKEARQEQIFATKTVSDFTNIDDAIIQGVLPLADMRPKSILLAIAGPVEGEEIPLTNSHWIIRPHDLIKKLGFKQVFVINDFEAQALATSALSKEYLIPIGPLDNLNPGSRVIMGPGTGLGVAGLAHLENRYIPIAGEGGHVDYAPRSQRDIELLPFLDKTDGRIRAEALLSGSGILSIYHAICKADGVEPILTSPNAITVAAHNTNEIQAREAINFFIHYLARLAGDFALTFKAKGGVFIGGGITPKIFKLINQQEFRNSFEDKAPHRHLLEKIPVFTLTHPRAALVGMDAYVRHPRRYLIDKKDRLWYADTDKL